MTHISTTTTSPIIWPRIPSGLAELFHRWMRNVHRHETPQVATSPPTPSRLVGLFKVLCDSYEFPSILIYSSFVLGIARCCCCRALNHTIRFAWGCRIELKQCVASASSSGSSSIILADLCAMLSVGVITVTSLTDWCDSSDNVTRVRTRMN